MTTIAAPIPEPTAEPELPAVEGATPSPDDLVGVWMEMETPDMASTGLLIRIGADGTATFDDGGRLDTHPAVVATYEIDGDAITFTAGSEQALDWCAGDTFAWRVGLPEEGLLNVLHTEAACGSSEGAEWTLVRVSPHSAPGAEINSSGSRDDAFVVNTTAALNGIWLLEGGGQLLRITAGNGNYALDGMGQLGSNSADTGTVALDGDGRLVLTSGEDTQVCDAGDEQVWEDVRVSAERFWATPSNDTCGLELGTELTWVRVSP